MSGQALPPAGPATAAGKLRVLFVGQMRQYKGVETLLAAVAGQDWLELTLVGGGHELVKYQRLAKRLSLRMPGSPEGCPTLSSVRSTRLMT